MYKKTKKWFLYTALIAGMLYSALTLNLAQTVYAACDCGATFQAAYEYCYLQTGSPVTTFYCDPAGSDFYAVCGSGQGISGPCQ